MGRFPRFGTNNTATSIKRETHQRRDEPSGTARSTTHIGISGSTETWSVCAILPNEDARPMCRQRQFKKRATSKPLGAQLCDATLPQTIDRTRPRPRRLQYARRRPPPISPSRRTCRYKSSCAQHVFVFKKRILQPRNRPARSVSSAQQQQRSLMSPLPISEAISHCLQAIKEISSRLAFGVSPFAARRGRRSRGTSAARRVIL